MRNPLVSFTVFSILLSCSSQGLEGPLTADAAVYAACKKCQMSAVQMTWLSLKIKESKEKPEKSGNFWAISTSAGVIIAHQPTVMSCLGCVLFDCNGNTPSLSPSVVANEVIPGMNSTNLIYEMGT
jgi:hypothetical protein